MFVAKRTDIESGQNYETPVQLTQYYTAPKIKDRVSSLVQFLRHCARYNITRGKGEKEGGEERAKRNGRKRGRREYD